MNQSKKKDITLPNIHPRYLQQVLHLETTQHLSLTLIILTVLMKNLEVLINQKLKKVILFIKDTFGTKKGEIKP